MIGSEAVLVTTLMVVHFQIKPLPTQKPRDWAAAFKTFLTVRRIGVFPDPLLAHTDGNLSRWSMHLSGNQYCG